MWNLVLSDIKYYKNYYIAIFAVTFILLLLSVFESEEVININITETWRSTVSTFIFMGALTFVFVLYDSKGFRERITASLPLSLTERKISRYIIYTLTLSINVGYMIFGLLFSNSYEFLKDLGEAFNRMTILAGGTFIVIEFLQIKVFTNKLVNAIAGAIIIITVLGGNLALQKYFVSSFENHILIAENLLAVIWAIILMFIAGFCFTKRVSFLNNN